MILISTITKLPNGKDATATLQQLSVVHAPLRFCWFFDGVYRAGFKTRPEAENWAKKEGVI